MKVLQGVSFASSACSEFDIANKIFNFFIFFKFIHGAYFAASKIKKVFIYYLLYFFNLIK